MVYAYYDLSNKLNDSHQLGIRQKFRIFLDDQSNKHHCKEWYQVDVYFWKIWRIMHDKYCSFLVYLHSYLTPASIKGAKSGSPSLSIKLLTETLWSCFLIILTCFSTTGETACLSNSIYNSILPLDSTVKIKCDKSLLLIGWRWCVSCHLSLSCCWFKQVGGCRGLGFCFSSISISKIRVAICCCNYPTSWPLSLG